MPGAEFGKNKLSYMEDTYLSQSHVGTHIDGLGHIGIQDCYYNQTPMGKYVTQNNLKRLGLENIKTFATRGVIIDMVKVCQAGNKLKPNSACKRHCLDAVAVPVADEGGVVVIRIFRPLARRAVGFGARGKRGGMKGIHRSNVRRTQTDVQPAVFAERLKMRPLVEPELRIGLAVADGVRRLTHPRHAERLEQRVVEAR